MADRWSVFLYRSIILLCCGVCWAVEPYVDSSVVPPVPNPYSLDERHAYIAFLQERIPGYQGAGKSDEAIKSDYAALFAPVKPVSPPSDDRGQGHGSDDQIAPAGVTRSLSELDAIRLQLRVDFGVVLDAGADLESARRILAEAQAKRRERESSRPADAEPSTVEVAQPNAPASSGRMVQPGQNWNAPAIPGPESVKPKAGAPWMAMTSEDIIAKVKGKRDDWVSSLLGAPSGVQVSVDSGNWRVEYWRYVSTAGVPGFSLRLTFTNRICTSVSVY